MPEVTEELQQAPGMDMEAAVDEIALGIGLTPEPSEEATEGQAAGAEEPAPVVVTPPKEPAPAEAAAKPAAETPSAEEPIPETWRKEAKEKWATVDPVVRAEVLKREEDIQRYVESVKTPVAVGSKFQELVGPYMADFAKAGINIFDNYAATLQMQKALAFGSPAEKMEVMQVLAKTAGLTLDGTALSAPETAQNDYVRSLEQRIQKMEAGVSTVAGTVREAQIQELSQSVLAFMQDKEKHPYAEALSDDMNVLIQKGFASSLEDAYRQAVVASPVYSQKLIESETEKRMKKFAEDEAARAALAKSASGANVRSNGSRRAAQPTESLDDTLKNALADINSRAH